MFKRKRVAARAFTADMLPQNRLQVFFDVIKIRWNLLLLIGLVALLFVFPLLAVRFFRLYEVGRVYEQIAAGTIEREAGHAQIAGLGNFAYLLTVPLWGIFGFGLAGLLRLTKKIIWSEYISLRHDFLLGIKENGVHFIILFLLFGIILFAGNYYYNRYLLIATGGVIRFVPLAATFLTVVPVFAFFVTMTAVYRERFLRKMSASVKIYLLTFPKTILVLAGCALPFGLFFLASNLMQLVYPPLFILFVLPLIFNAWFLYSCSVFDKFINKKHFPSIVDKGIWR